MKRFFLTWLVKITAPVVIFLWSRSLRLTTSGKTLPKNGILVFWHQHIFAVIAYLSRFSTEQPITALVSGSDDGKILQIILKAFHFNIVEGSSTKGGFPSLLHLERNFGADEILLITPDGPKGPAATLKPGALHLAKFSSKPLTAVHVIYHNFWRLNTWDRAFLPKPFSTCDIVFSDPVLVNRKTSEFELTELQNKLESYLHGHQSHSGVEESIR